MADNIIDFEGFEKYGPIANGQTFASLTVGNFTVNSVGATPLLNQGFLQEWLSFFEPANVRPAGLIKGLGASQTGTALYIQSSSGGSTILTRSMPANYARVIFGFAFMCNLVGTPGVELSDGGTSQVAVWVDSSGRVNFGRGGVGGTILFTSAALIAVNTRHYIEVDVKIDPSAGHYQVWLDGVSLTNSNNSQNTRSTSNSFANQLRLDTGGTGGVAAAYDDMYWRDNTTATATPFGDCSVIGLPVTSDNSVQFSPAATVLGPWYAQQTTSTNAPGVRIALVPVTPAVNMTVNSVGIFPSTANGTVKNKGVIYSDSSGNPGSLLSDGTEVVGTTANVAATLPLVTPQALTAGTQYWIGYYTDTSLALQLSDTWTTSGQSKLNTYASNAPAGPLSGMTTGLNPWSIWGNCTGAASNYAGVNRTTPPLVAAGLTALSYNQDSTVGHEDLFEVTDLTVTPSSIFSVKVSALAERTDAGARTMDIRLKSNTTDSAGTNTGVTPPTTMGWSSTRYDTDPDTSAAWTSGGINAIKVGYKVAS